MIKKASDTSDMSDKLYNALRINTITTDKVRTKHRFMSEVVRNGFFQVRTGSDRFGRDFGRFLIVTCSFSVFYNLSEAVCTLKRVSEILQRKSANLPMFNV